MTLPNPNEVNVEITFQFNIIQDAALPQKSSISMLEQKKMHNHKPF
jgi:hypothetical protein